LKEVSYVHSGRREKCAVDRLVCAPVFRHRSRSPTHAHSLLPWATHGTRSGPSMPGHLARSEYKNINTVIRKNTTEDKNIVIIKVQYVHSH
jgi:hypothetical protein